MIPLSVKCDIGLDGCHVSMSAFVPDFLKQHNALIQAKGWQINYNVSAICPHCLWKMERARMLRRKMHDAY